jgi:hypothetical protein
MVELTQTELLNGFFIVIIVIIYFYIGFKLYAKYIAYKDIKLIYLGTNVIFQSIGWFSIALTYVMILAFGVPLPDSLYILIGHGIAPISLLSWVLLLSEIMWKNKQKIILIIFGIYFVLITVIFFYLWVTDLSALGTVIGNLDFNMAPFLIIRSLLSLVIGLSTVILFFRESHKSDNPEVRLKGTLFLLGVLLLFGGVILFVIVQTTFITLVFTVPSALCLYAGLIMPDWIKKIFIKEREQK